MDEGLPKVFSEKERALIITPAGCGKTEIIARAVSFSDASKGRQLILTHTHAGVKSIYDRLKKLGVSRKNYYIDTIAGFALQYAASFPSSSGLGKDFDPSTHEWDKVYPSANNIVSSKFGKKVITASFCGMYVDEYQDCTKQQHEIILKLADYLPCRILGDPLQGIFGFRDPLINWYEDVFPQFEMIGDKNTKWVPYRWKEKNENLGNWLLQARNTLRAGKQLDFRTLPQECRWIPLSSVGQRTACLGKVFPQETVVAIQHWAHQAHALAKTLNGSFTSMEEIESKDLIKWAKDIENSRGIDRAVKVIKFASTCMTVVSTSLSRIKQKLEKGEKTAKDNLRHKDIFDVLVQISEDNQLSLVLDAFEKIDHIQERVLYRKELWRDMKKTIEEKILSNSDVELYKIAWSIRERGRIVGRNVDRRIVSRTLLIKGLEFDHAIVANADELDAKELYVAITRGSKSLTVLSANPVIQKPIPTDLLPPKKG
jgi:DNA helicase-2/ATP-dependent DNA helicase PcrA